MGREGYDVMFVTTSVLLCASAATVAASMRITRTFGDQAVLWEREAEANRERIAMEKAFDEINQVRGRGHAKRRPTTSDKSSTSAASLLTTSEVVVSDGSADEVVLPVAPELPLPPPPMALPPLHPLLRRISPSVSGH
eukprot:7255011-Prymnesium_polylepis.1